MLEGQVLEAYTTLVLLHMVNKLINGIPWRFQLKHQSAHLVVEKSGNCLDLHAVAIINTYFIQVSIRLIIVSESKGRYCKGFSYTSIYSAYFCAVLKSCLISATNPSLN